MSQWWLKNLPHSKTMSSSGLVISDLWKWKSDCDVDLSTNKCPHEQFFPLSSYWLLNESSNQYGITALTSFLPSLLIFSVSSSELRSTPKFPLHFEMLRHHGRRPNLLLLMIIMMMSSPWLISTSDACVGLCCYGYCRQCTDPNWSVRIFSLDAHSFLHMFIISIHPSP